MQVLHCQPLNAPKLQQQAIVLLVALHCALTYERFFFPGKVKEINNVLYAQRFRVRAPCCVLKLCDWVNYGSYLPRFYLQITCK